VKAKTQRFDPRTIELGSCDGHMVTALPQFKSQGEACVEIAERSDGLTLVGNDRGSPCAQME
jgi:hypothetical protein